MTFCWVRWFLLSNLRPHISLAVFIMTLNMIQARHIIIFTRPTIRAWSYAKLSISRDRVVNRGQTYSIIQPATTNSYFDYKFVVGTMTTVEWVAVSDQINMWGSACKWSCRPLTCSIIRWSPMPATILSFTSHQWGLLLSMMCHLSTNLSFC